MHTNGMAPSVRTRSRTRRHVPAFAIAHAHAPGGGCDPSLLRVHARHPNRFVAHLLAEQEARGLSPTAFARLIGVDGSTWYRWRQGLSEKPDTAKLRKVAAALDEPLSTLLELLDVLPPATDPRAVPPQISRLIDLYHASTADERSALLSQVAVINEWIAGRHAARPRRATGRQSS